MLNQRLQQSNTDNMVMLAGLTRARGFRLDDYGVVFDVEFPSMRRSMVWSIQELERANAGRAVKAAESTPVVRPREIYQTEITSALVNAILDNQPNEAERLTRQHIRRTRLSIERLPDEAFASII